jgi:hypothetical protein
MNENLCSNSATVITASSENANFPASNLKNPLRSKRWRSTDISSESVVFDFLTTEPVDSVAILWSKEDGILLSNTAVIKIQANATDVWTSPAVDQTLTINNDYEIASHYFTTDQSYRYWRVLITDAGNPNGFLELGVVWIGKSLDLDFAENGFKWSIADMSRVTETAYGHKYVDELPSINTLEFSYRFMEYAEIQVLEEAYRINGKRLPVFVAMDAEEAVFDKDHFAIYGMFNSSFTEDHVVRSLFNPSGIRIEELP